MNARLAAVAAALLAALAPGPAAAQPEQSSVVDASGLEWLEGRWRGEGRRGGERLAAELEVRPVLGGAFLEFVYRSGGFEGRAFYSTMARDDWRGQWFDSRGASFPIAATSADRTFTADWGSPETERGRTVYAMRDDGQLEITDSVAAPDGTRHVFATHRLRRLP